ncbi:unnamed protein product [Camellia sinensis]
MLGRQTGVDSSHTLTTLETPLTMHRKTRILAQFSPAARFISIVVHSSSSVAKSELTSTTSVQVTCRLQRCSLEGLEVEGLILLLPFCITCNSSEGLYMQKSYDSPFVVTKCLTWKVVSL